MSCHFKLKNLIYQLLIEATAWAVLAGGFEPETTGHLAEAKPRSPYQSGILGRINTNRPRPTSAKALTAFSFFDPNIKPATGQPDRSFMGGSNYFFYDLGSFGTQFNHPPDKPWANSANTPAWHDIWYSAGAYAPEKGPQLVIQNLHHPSVLAKVRLQLADMHKQGQTAIAIPIWLADSATLTHADHYGHLFDWNGLTDQQKSNLLTLTHEIYQAGFLKITYRFNLNGDADPSAWKTWKPDSFQKCNQFVLETIGLLRQSLLAGFGSCQNRWAFDLGGELGGSERGQSTAYTAQLMKNYIDSGLPIDETFGFSMLCTDNNSGRYFQNQYATLSALGPAYVPKSWAVTCYSRTAQKTNVQDSLTLLAQAMQRAGCQNQPVIVLECLNNDTAEAVEISNALNLNPTLNIIELYQWPLSRGALENRVWTVDAAYADDIMNYLNVGRSANPGTFSFERSSHTVKENAVGKATIKVLRSGSAQGAISLPFTTANGTAVAGSDYVATSGHLIFSDGERSATLTIVILNDKLPEGPETFRVALGTPSNPAASLGTCAIATVTIQSDEALPQATCVAGGSATIAKGFLTAVKINFSNNLDQNSTKNLDSYRLFTPGKDNVFGTADDTRLPLTKIAYDNSKTTLTLNCKPYKMTTNLRLKASGTGNSAILDKYNRPIDGDNNGSPGGDALIKISKTGEINF